MKLEFGARGSNELGF